MTDSGAKSGHENRPLHEDDPLMELSRIFSFDRPAAGSADQNARHVNDPYAGDGGVDPVLDLERELYGDFDNFLMPSHPADEQPHITGRQPSDFHSEGHHPVLEQEFSHQDADIDFSLDPLELSLDDDLPPAPQAQSGAPEVMEFVDVEQGEAIDPFNFDDVIEGGSHYAEETAQHSVRYEAQPYDDTEPHFAHERHTPEQHDYAEHEPVAHVAETHDHAPSDRQGHEPEWHESASDWQSDIPVQAYDVGHQAAAPQEPALSLEDELERLLFSSDGTHDPETQQRDYAAAHQDHQPVVEDNHAAEVDYQPEAEPDISFDEHDFRLEEVDLAEETVHDEPETGETAAYSRLVEPSGFPRYKLSNFATGEQSTSRHAQDASMGQAGENAFSSGDDDEHDLSLDDDFAFEPQQTQAADGAEATEDDLFSLDGLELTDDDFDFEPSGDHLAAQQDEISLTTDDLDMDDFFQSDMRRVAEADEHAFADASAEQVARADDDSVPSFTSLSGQKSAAFTPPPEIETLSVSESKVEQTHAFDLPEVDYGEEEPSARLAELEAEFTDVFNTIEVDETATQTETQSEADKAFEDIFRESASTYLPGGKLAATTAMGLDAAADSYIRAKTASQSSSSATASSEDFYNHWAMQGSQALEGDDYGARASMPAEDDLGRAADAYRERPVRGRRGLIFATIAGVAVLLGGVGYHFLADGGSDEPVLIRADDQPVKVQPENPGGVVVPNQDKAVYDRVSGTLPDSPEQKQLITTGEDPIDISGTDDSESPEDEGQGENVASAQPPAERSEPEPLIKPREVETMVVRSDGTILPPSAKEPAVTQPATPEPEAVKSAESPASETAGRDQIAEIAAGGDPAPEPIRPPETAAKPEEQTKPAEQVKPPVKAPLVPSRPAQQPVTVVAKVPQRAQAETAPAQAAQPAQPAAAVGAANGGGYFIQVSSQPSAELAQKSYADIARKYGSVIGGRSVDIKRADIPGKGTYYRVRVSAGSREDATALCNRLKAAGGSCLVTR